MIYLTIYSASGEEKFCAKGSDIEAIYNGELLEGDVIKIRLDGTNVVKVKFDEKLKESYLYLPNKAFYFIIPTERELKMAYPPETETPWKAFDLTKAVEIK